MNKRNFDSDPSISLEWAKYQGCVKYLTKDTWTRQEYLNYATTQYASGQDDVPERPLHLLLGAQHPVMLVPGKPDFSRYFLIPAFDFVVGSFVKLWGTMDPSEEETLRSLTSPGDCVVEVGSNIGSYTTALADQVGPRGLVYAFEPFRKIFQIMNANLALQGMGNVVTKQIGISSKRQYISVKAPDLNAFTNLGASRVFFQQDEEISKVFFDGYEEIEVDALDNLRLTCGQTTQDGEKKVDLIKIDAEGMEWEVVQGGANLIRAHQPLIYAESQPYFQAGDRTFLRRMCDEHGYMCFPLQNLEIHEIILCIPQSRHEELKEKHPILRR